MQTDLTTEEANDLAEEILRGRDFVGANEPGFFSRTTSRVWREIGDFLGDIFSAIFGSAGGGAGSFIAYLLLAGVVVILLVAIVKAIRTGRLGKSAKAESGVRIVFDEEVDPTELRRELADRRSRGDWRGAVVAGFRLAVVEMIDHGLVAERAGATTGDFGRAIEVSSPQLTGIYRRASDAFERAFYSDSVIDQGDLEAVTDLLKSLEVVVSE